MIDACGRLVARFNRERRREAVGGDPFPFSPITQPLLITSFAPFAVSSWARRHICLTLDVLLIRSSNMLAASRVTNMTIQSECEYTLLSTVIDESWR
jgi:hypothetical protein